MPVGFKQTSITQIDIPDKLPNIPILDDYTLASLLGSRTKTLWYHILYRNDLYKVFTIPKANGGARLIHAPQNSIKRMLKKLNARLLNPLQEDLGKHVAAYRKQHSIRDAVAQHIRPCPICDSLPINITPKKHDCPKYGTLIKIDLKDFFHSTHKSWVCRYFSDTGYTPQVSDLLSNLTTVSVGPEGTRKKDVVPQGSPTSGAICNLVANQRLDRSIQGYLRVLNVPGKYDPPWDWRYMRYSDDLIITCGHLIPREERNRIVNKLRYVIHDCGYRVNPKKVRATHSFYRKRVLGVVINKKMNIPREDYRKLRAIVHNCNTYGFDTQYEKAGKKNAGELMSYLQGRIGYVQFINPQKGDQLMSTFLTAKTKWENRHV